MFLLEVQQVTLKIQSVNSSGEKQVRKFVLEKQMEDPKLLVTAHKSGDFTTNKAILYQLLKTDVKILLHREILVKRILW